MHYLIDFVYHNNKHSKNMTKNRYIYICILLLLIVFLQSMHSLSLQNLHIAYLSCGVCIDICDTSFSASNRGF